MKRKGTAAPSALASLVALASLAAPGCVSDERADGIDDYIRGLERLPAPESQVIEGAKSAPEREGDYSCTVQDFNETRRYDRLVAFAANSESLWPGALVHGDSIQDGLFTQAVFDRAPLAVSISLENLAGARSAVMQQPSLSAFREALGGILSAEITGDTPANIFAEIEEVHTQEQLAIAMGASASWGGLPLNVSASFNFEDQAIRSRYLVKYVQAYYTVDVDQPRRPSDVFADDVLAEDIEATFGDGNPPVYVSSITYGRTILFTFESEFSSTELGTALDFVYSGGPDVSGSVSVSNEDVVSRTRITAYILGGSGGDAAQSIDGYDALVEFIRGGGNYSPESPGAPIAYKLAYLADNAPARMSFSNDYQVVDCVRVSQKVRVTLDSITVEAAPDEVGSGGNLEIYGTVRAAAETSAAAWETSASQYISIEEGQTYSLPDGPLGEAIIQVVPEEGNAIRLTADIFDEDGLSGDDNFPVVEVNADFQSGWRRTIPVLVTNDGARVRLAISLQPI